MFSTPVLELFAGLCMSTLPISLIINKEINQRKKRREQKRGEEGKDKTKRKIHFGMVPSLFCRFSSAAFKSPLPLCTAYHVRWTTPCSVSITNVNLPSYLQLILLFLLLFSFSSSSPSPSLLLSFLFLFFFNT